MDNLNKLFEKVKINSEKNYDQISVQYDNPYSTPGLNTLREEICICLTLNLFQAAITLTNHLFENGLKTLLILSDFYKNKKQDSDIIDKMDELLDKFDRLNLFDTITKAFQYKIISGPEKKQLLEFKNKYRNPFSHANKRGIYGEEKSIVEEFKFGNNGIYIERQEHLKSNLLPFQDIFQLDKAKEESFEYFICIDKIIRESYVRIIKRKKASP